jgi:hypothetical protein
MEETKVKQLYTSVEETNEKSSSKEELIKRKEVKNSPFTVITHEGQSFGVMGEYRVTEKMDSAKAVEKEVTKITWNRIVQVMMILNDLNNKQQKKDKK